VPVRRRLRALPLVHGGRSTHRDGQKFCKLSPYRSTLKFWSSPRTLVARVGRLNLALVHSSDTHTVCSLTLTAGAQRGYWGYYAKITATLVTSPIRREVPAGRSLCSLMLPRTEQEASPPAPPERETGEPLRRRNATEVLSSS